MFGVFRIPDVATALLFLFPENLQNKPQHVLLASVLVQVKVVHDALGLMVQSAG